ncbi:YhgE/Pip domain-containing protein [Yinghuangia seranimata]|uniref:YhgE/Pip domain-containing protein n=1 Tax=Yinghuangia seranimata TaxID=408067 RepID=UPI00248C99DB|nr:ABC transporter permease [Yinghuangia seranimata]MDI2128380.1 DUF3533 domain-containing protein [Yinghuangia seranimata]
MSNSSSEPPATSTWVRARDVLRQPRMWVLSAISGTVVVALMSIIYFGYTVDPPGHLRGLPVSVVNQDAGGEVAGRPVNYGLQITDTLAGTPTITRRLDVDVTSLQHAKEQMDKGHSYVTVLVPPDFTRSVLALGGGAPPATPGVPVVQLLTNQRAGSTGVGLATGVLQPALAQITDAIGQQVAASPGLAQASPEIKAVVAEAVQVTTVPYRPLPSHTGLGLSAFFISLIATMCGFMGGTIVHTNVDVALGYATSAIGPRTTQRRPRLITHWQMLKTKWLLAAAITPLLCAVMLIAAVGMLGMDAPHLGLLWVFLSLSAVAVAIGTLVLLVTLGQVGQLVAILVFVYLALASSGGSVPLQALSGFFRFVSAFEPLRQILDGVRSILYFDAQADAGLTRGFVMATIGLAFWLVLGAAVTNRWDRKGTHRLSPKVVDLLSKHDTD